MSATFGLPDAPASAPSVLRRLRNCIQFKVGDLLAAQERIRRGNLLHHPALLIVVMDCGIDERRQHIPAFFIQCCLQLIWHYINLQDGSIFILADRASEHAIVISEALRHNQNKREQTCDTGCSHPLVLHRQEGRM